jgi:mxaL protein
MIRPAFRDLRFWLLVAAFLLVVAGLFLPRVKLTRNAYDALAIIDITSSMNVRDLTLGGKPASRLDVVKDRLRELVANLPCESRLGLGIFSERRVFVLFDPVETCENFSSIDASITGLDWRMAWEGDSRITGGIHDGIAAAKGLGVDLLFFTDGHEAPPLPWTGLPAFEGKPGETKGLIVGVGGKTLSPIPKYDDDGREIGTIGPDDVLQENRAGPPPPDAASRPGYHPKWAPFGDVQIDNNEHLSSVKEDHLRAVAAQTGLAYTTLDGASALLRAFEAAATPRKVVVATDVRPYPAALALLLLVILFGLLPLRDRLTARAPALRAAPKRQSKAKLEEVYP